MPQCKRGRGYTHWNPGNPNAHELFSATNIPRLIDTRKRAVACIVQWAAMPNSRSDMDGDIVLGKIDNRKKEDLEIIEAWIKVKLTGDPYWSEFEGIKNVKMQKMSPKSDI